MQGQGKLKAICLKSIEVLIPEGGTAHIYNFRSLKTDPQEQSTLSCTVEVQSIAPLPFEVGKEYNVMVRADSGIQVVSPIKGVK